MSKSLEDRAIDIKGKKYVQVADRIIYFNETYPNGCIKTKLLSELNADRVIMRAEVFPDMVTDFKRSYIAHSQALWGDGFINKTSAIENCETSAVGRALALMGIGVIDSVASVDEIEKAHIAEEQSRQTTNPRAIDEIKLLMIDKGITEPDDQKRLFKILSNGQALNTSGIARIKKEVTMAMPDTLQEVLNNETTN